MKIKHIVTISIIALGILFVSCSKNGENTENNEEEISHNMQFSYEFILQSFSRYKDDNISNAAIANNIVDTINKNEMTNNFYEVIANDNDFHNNTGGEDSWIFLYLAENNIHCKRFVVNTCILEDDSVLKSMMKTYYPAGVILEKQSKNDSDDTFEVIKYYPTNISKKMDAIIHNAFILNNGENSPDYIEALNWANTNRENDYLTNEEWITNVKGQLSKYKSQLDTLNTLDPPELVARLDEFRIVLIVLYELYL